MEGLSTNTQLLFFLSFLGTLGGFWALPQPCPLLLIHLALTLYASCLGLDEQQQDIIISCHTQTMPNIEPIRETSLLRQI